MGIDLKDKGAEKLSKVLMGSSVTRLELTWLGFGSEGAKSLARVLPQTQIRSLIINGNMIGDDGVEAICNSMSKLSELELYEAGISSEGALKMSNALGKHALLEVLNLYGNTIGNEGAKFLAKAIAVMLPLSLIERNPHLSLLLLLFSPPSPPLLYFPHLLIIIIIFKTKQKGKSQTPRD
jgi:hypothetical protein